MISKALNDFFNIKAKGSSIRQESIAGLTTFLTMAYIIFINPYVLKDAGMPFYPLITATILAACFGTLLAGFWANMPFAMAPGMGLNAFFTYSLVIGQQVNWQTALGVVFVSGVVFFLLTLLGLRKHLLRVIPKELRLSVAAGIGLFITFIGVSKLGLIVDHPSTLVTLGKITLPITLGLFGLATICVLELKKVKGSFIIAILLVCVVGFAVREPNLINQWRNTTANGFQWLSMPPSLEPLWWQLDIKSALKWGFIGSIFSFTFVDLFDSLGTIVACSYEGGMVKKNGEIENLDKLLEADAVATIAGAFIGTSTTTTFVESGAGIAQGGRTGLASCITALCFAASLFLTPLIALVPSYATAPALIFVGILMFKNAAQIDWRRLDIAIPAFLTIVLMPLTYSISTGLSFGFISYILVQIAIKKAKGIPNLLWIIGILSALELAYTFN